MSGIINSKKIDCKSVVYYDTNIQHETDVPFVPTPMPVVSKMLAMAEVNSNDKVYDLGCGDGRIVLMAAQNYGAQAVGYDIDTQKIDKCKINAQQAGLSTKVTFINNNFFDAPIGDASVITLYLLTNINVRLQKKIFSELNPGTRIVSHEFNMENWIADKYCLVNSHSIYLWYIPANVTGIWQWIMNLSDETFRCTINIEQHYQKIKATFIDTENCFVNSMIVKGSQIEIRFRVYLNGAEKFYIARGTIKSHTIKGTITSNLNNPIEWLALRRPETTGNIII